ncbi:hypothetical protein [Flammeovirga sp. SJP92]|uniref:hypothetical protein n=1 Tax=Flammeovirga sp. SJP92 TaxID=1775430 RepID=UPI0007892650|nr:hypothetical protein [Flammeovirga sp. SJP92]KXX71070.1 hypothetical protein AVL50_10740 [Flammeovirga sp. SJP92]
MLPNYLIENFENTIKNYFPSDSANAWKEKYKKKIEQIDHDEPWLTLIACYAVLGNWKNTNKDNIDALNEIFQRSGLEKTVLFNSITKVKVEEKLPEIKEYRAYLKEAFTKDNFHLYPDRRTSINQKIITKTASFEGNTNLDLLIEGMSNNRKITCFIEAKFLSDISYQTTYNPVRDQIIRNIDCGIDYVNGNKSEVDFKDFYFLLLTPQIFKSKNFGLSKTSLLNQFGANSSRFYCYKMEEYSNYQYLKQNLPHRNLKDSEWRSIAKNIGWLSFEDFYYSCRKYSTFINSSEEEAIIRYFEERNLTP